MWYRMRTVFALLLIFVMAGGLSSAGDLRFGSTQQGVARGPIVPRDPELEKQSYRNLEVAKFYFYKRKPENRDKDGWSRLNKAVESRLTEIIDTNPSFARMDDVYFLLGELYKRMGESEKAIEYWTKAEKETSDEKIKSEAQKRINENKKDKKE